MNILQGCLNICTELGTIEMVENQQKNNIFFLTKLSNIPKTNNPQIDLLADDIDKIQMNIAI